jgi:predicted DNA-binding transcriptional regulator AlpA
VFTHRPGHFSWVHIVLCTQETLPLHRIMCNPIAVATCAYARSMARRYHADDLVGVAEIANRLGLGTSVVHSWRRRHRDFPKPIVHLHMGLVWSWEDVEEWARSTGRVPL